MVAKLTGRQRPITSNTTYYFQKVDAVGLHMQQDSPEDSEEVTGGGNEADDEEEEEKGYEDRHVENDKDYGADDNKDVDKEYDEDYNAEDDKDDDFIVIC